MGTGHITTYQGSTRAVLDEGGRLPIPSTLTSLLLHTHILEKAGGLHTSKRRKSKDEERRFFTLYKEKHSYYMDRTGPEA